VTCLNLLSVKLKGLDLELVFVGGYEERKIGSPFVILKMIVEDFCGEDP
jgi:hypothetical protein